MRRGNTGRQARGLEEENGGGLGVRSNVHVCWKGVLIRPPSRLSWYGVNVEGYWGIRGRVKSRG